MNVLFVTQWYPSREKPVNGIFVREHALAVATRHRVTVVFIKGMDRNQAAIPRFKPVEDGPLSTYTLTYPTARIPKTTWVNRYKAVVRVIDDLIATGARPDIIHAHVYNTADVAYLLQRRYRIPAVLTEHSSAIPRRLIPQRQRMVMRYCENRIQLILPVSNNLASFIPEYGIHTPMEVIPNTFNRGIFYPGARKTVSQDGSRQILVVAGLVPVKGIDFLLQALALVKQEGGCFEVKIAGDGPDRDKLSRMASDLGISENIQFLGFQNKLQVAELMRQADFLALTSRWDNNPVAVIEAMASGLPVLASRVGGISEMVSPEQGVLVEVGNVREIAEKLLHMLDHSHEYSMQEISDYARKKFCYETIGQSFSAAYDRAIDQYQNR